VRKTVLLLAVLTLAFLTAAAVSARTVRGFKLPSTARKITENLYYLGRNARGAQGYAFIYRKDSAAKPPWAGDGKDKGGSGDIQCYGFLAKNARWKTTEGYVADIDSPATELSLETWDSEVSFDIFGARNTGYGGPFEADASAPDGLNELYFGAIDEPGVIGVTTVWGYFSGPPRWRELIEWDMVLDDVDFVWGDAGSNPAVMDYQNILTHELGHAAGLADLYESGCSEETMYGYGTEGETKKRDLNPGDVAGIQELYK